MQEIRIKQYLFLVLFVDYIERNFVDYIERILETVKI